MTLARLTFVSMNKREFKKLVNQIISQSVSHFICSVFAQCICKHLKLYKAVL